MAWGHQKFICGHTQMIHGAGVYSVEKEARGFKNLDSPRVCSSCQFVLGEIRGEYNPAYRKTPFDHLPSRVVAGEEFVYEFQKAADRLTVSCKVIAVDYLGGVFEGVRKIFNSSGPCGGNDFSGPWRTEKSISTKETSLRILVDPRIKGVSPFELAYTYGGWRWLEQNCGSANWEETPKGIELINRSRQVSVS